MHKDIQTIYQETIAFAALKHGNQKMPTGLPCVVHLSKVAMEVFMTHKKEPNFNIDLAIQLALLHDVLEDTFGNLVATGVLALTKNTMMPTFSINEISKKEQDRYARSLRYGYIINFDCN